MAHCTVTYGGLALNRSNNNIGFREAFKKSLEVFHKGWGFTAIFFNTLGKDKNSVQVFFTFF